MLAVGLAVLVARWPNGIMDRISLAISMMGLSIAPYVLALVLVYIFAVKVQWFPAIGYTSPSANLVENIKSLTLPAASLGFPLFAVYTRLLRADIVEQMQREDYIVTARAKGVRPWRILLRHALPNSMFGLITLVGLNLGTLIGATAIIEPIFSLPGAGDILVQSINDHDVPVVEGIVVVFAWWSWRPTCSPTSCTPLLTRGSAMAASLPDLLVTAETAGARPPRARGGPAGKRAAPLGARRFPHRAGIRVLHLAADLPGAQAVGGSVLDAGLPPLSPGHIFGTDPVGNDVFSASCTAARSRSRSGSPSPPSGWRSAACSGSPPGTSVARSTRSSPACSTC